MARLEDSVGSSPCERTQLTLCREEVLAELALASSHAHERALEAATDRDIVIALSIVHLCKPPNDSLEGQTGIPVEERAPERRPVESPHGVELAGILRSEEHTS